MTGLLILALLGIALRLICIYSGERHTDPDTYYRAWGVKTSVHGLLSAYEPLGHYQAIEYPPLTPYLFLFLTKAHNVLSAHVAAIDWFYYLFKFFLLFTDIVLGILLFREARHIRRFTALFALYALNPGLIIDSVLWGQLDNLYTLFLVLGLLALCRQKHGLSGLFLGLACLTKIQALILAPVFLAALLFKKRYHETGLLLLACAGIYLVFSLPFLLHGDWRALFAVYLNSKNVHPSLSMNAYNGWWLWTHGNGFQPDTVTVMMGLSARLIGALLFGLFYAAAMARLKQNPDRTGLFLCAAFISYAFFQWPTQMHERYLYPVLLLLLFQPVMLKKDWALFGAAGAAYFVNMIAVFGGQQGYVLFTDAAFVRTLSLWTAAVNLVIFVLFSVRLWRAEDKPRELPAAASD